MVFECTEDEQYFKTLLGVRDLEPYAALFDFRPVAIKRAEFNRLHTQLYQQLIERDGKQCAWHLVDDCEQDQHLAIDHLVPLSSNKMNKELRLMKPTRGKTVLTQSLGSNNPANLVLACAKCNNHKKHRLLDIREYIRRQ